MTTERAYKISAQSVEDICFKIELQDLYHLHIYIYTYLHTLQANKRLVKYNNLCTYKTIKNGAVHRRRRKGSLQSTPGESGP